MALFSIDNISITGISACVPSQKISNTEYNPYLSKDDRQKIINTTGIENRRVVDKHSCTSDLCLKAAEELLESLNWKKSEVDLLVFVSQTPDYILPMTSSILQHKLGLSNNCIAFDATIGCSGYCYGLAIVSSMLSSIRGKKALLLVGDTISKITSPQDRSTFPLFGDAGTATALCFDERASSINFHLATDGKGYKSIIVKDGGQRNPVKTASFIDKADENGLIRNDSQLFLNGIDVFNFGISQAPKSVSDLLNFSNISKEDINFFIFHQANKLMNETIRKKLKIETEKVPYSLKNFGNTSSATIPLTIVSELKEQVTSSNQKVVLCGFGVGLSWGSVLLDINKIVCPDIIDF